MKEILATVTQRGQVTLPAEVRRLLGAKPRDKVAFRIDGNHVQLVPASFSLETAYGSVQPIERPEDFKKISRRVKAERVERVLGQTREP